MQLGAGNSWILVGSIDLVASFVTTFLPRMESGSHSLVSSLESLERGTDPQLSLDFIDLDTVS
jgi:hypothetical protein